MSEDKTRFSSPACAMQEVGDAYMGYATPAEMAAFLNELLEAERAGSRVTLESAREAGSGAVADVMTAIQRDEARWCAMLLRHIERLGAEPTATTGAFYGKAMAIAAMSERIAFLNRGQGWVVKKLRLMLPKVRDDGLHADLEAMLRSHVANIALADKLAAGTR